MSSRQPEFRFRIENSLPASESQGSRPLVLRDSLPERQVEDFLQQYIRD